MTLARAIQIKHQFLKAANEPLCEELHDQRFRELPQSVRDSLPPIVVKDRYHRVYPTDTVIVIPSLENL